MSKTGQTPITGESGFSYIDVMVAMVILLVGILGYLSAMAAGVMLSRGQQQQLAARHISATAIESIMSAKETDEARLGWDAIGNVGSNLDENDNPQGVFTSGFVQVVANAGSDEVVGTADDSGAALSGYRRRVVITDICDPDRPSENCAEPGVWPVRMRRVDVTVRYYVGSAEREEVIATILTDYTVAE